MPDAYKNLFPFLQYHYFAKDVSSFDTATSSSLAKVSVPEQIQDDFISWVSVDTSTQSFSIRTWKSSDFKEKLAFWALEKERDIVELKSVITWQKKCLDYQSVYNAYLLGTLTAEEFESDSEEYTSDMRNITKEEILTSIQRLNRLLEGKFTVSDFASYLQTDPSVVSEAIESAAGQLSYFSPKLENTK